MLSIQGKYEYNPENVISFNSNTGLITFKGRLKKDPKEIVFIKKIPNARALSEIGNMGSSVYDMYQPGKYCSFHKLMKVKKVLTSAKVGSSGIRTRNP